MPYKNAFFTFTVFTCLIKLPSLFFGNLSITILSNSFRWLTVGHLPCQTSSGLFLNFPSINALARHHLIKYTDLLTASAQNFCCEHFWNNMDLTVSWLSDSPCANCQLPLFLLSSEIVWTSLKCTLFLYQSIPNPWSHFLKMLNTYNLFLMK